MKKQSKTQHTKIPSIFCSGFFPFLVLNLRFLTTPPFPSAKRTGRTARCKDWSVAKKCSTSFGLWMQIPTSCKWRRCRVDGEDVVGPDAPFWLLASFGFRVGSGWVAFQAILVEVVLVFKALEGIHVQENVEVVYKRWGVLLSSATSCELRFSGFLHRANDLLQSPKEQLAELAADLQVVRAKDEMKKLSKAGEWPLHCFALVHLPWLGSAWLLLVWCVWVCLFVDKWLLMLARFGWDCSAV